MTTATEGAGNGAPQGKQVRTPQVSRQKAGEQRAASLLDTVLKSLDESKAEDTVSISLAGKSSIGDHMIVASGRSQRHVGAMADRLLSDLKDAGFGRARIEGLPHCDWLLVDAGDVIVHLFRPEVRQFYNLEKMWTASNPEERLAV